MSLFARAGSGLHLLSRVFINSASYHSSVPAWMISYIDSLSLILLTQDPQRPPSDL